MVVSVDIVGNVASFVGQFECLNGRGMESVKTVKVFAASGSSAWTTWSEWTKWLVSASRILVMLPSVINLAMCVGVYVFAIGARTVWATGLAFGTMVGFNPEKVVA